MHTWKNYRIEIGSRDSLGRKRIKLIVNQSAANRRRAEHQALKLANFQNAEVFSCEERAA